MNTDNDQVKQRISVFDLHCDTLDKLLELSRTAPGEGFSPYTASTDIALSQMGAYDWCQCFAVYIPDGLGAEMSWEHYQKGLRAFKGLLQNEDCALTQAASADDIMRAIDSNRSAAILTIEGAAFLDGSLAPIGQIAADGVKAVTLTWNAANAVAGGVGSTAGFSSFGRQVVKALEQNHVIVDASHLNDQSFSDLQKLATRPFIATHSNSRTVCAHPRNLTDDQFLAIMGCGGLVGMNFCEYFIVDDQRPVVPDDIFSHLEHWLLLGGEDHVALGSDYDGAPVPEWLVPSSRLGFLYEQSVARFGTQVTDKWFFTNAYGFMQRNA
ncbi:MAG: dipeptidase [Coriobacteriia bacterium]|nr:dipeptidase [Coriobacteriia bacterium]